MVPERKINRCPSSFARTEKIGPYERREQIA
jgi:hypothetical protein